MRETKVFNVEGMSCSHCENAIKKAVGALLGVENVSVDLKGKTVTAVFDNTQTSTESIKETIEDQGYDII